MNLDDSGASLLANGQRKKPTTSYKRPGPPTPSKNAGRLSLGGTMDSIPYRDILKDATNDHAAASKKSTPSRFRLFGGGNKGNEVSRILKKIFKKKRVGRGSDGIGEK